MKSAQISASSQLETLELALLTIIFDYGGGKYWSIIFLILLISNNIFSQMPAKLRNKR